MEKRAKLQDSHFFGNLLRPEHVYFQDRRVPNNFFYKSLFVFRNSERGSDMVAPDGRRGLHCYNIA